jgi:pimeloyl-ACP methyl ester carboxylesterase
MQLYIKNNYASKLNMGNPSSKLVHSSVFPELHNTRSTEEICEWLKTHKFVISAPSGHTVSQKTIHYTRDSEKSTYSDICLVYLHGNAEDMCSVDIFKQCETYQLVAFEYPGYGIRQGESIDEMALIDAVPLMAEWLRDNVPEDKKIVICGRSLGTFVALRLAHELEGMCKALILVSPMLSAISTRVSAPWYHFLWPIDMIHNKDFVTNEYENKTSSVMLIHGKKDEIVPCDHSACLAELLKKKNIEVDVRMLPHADHNDIFVHGDTWQYIKEVLEAKQRQ